MNTSWTWSFNGYDPKKERLVEALCTLGNGRFATRGAGPEATAGPVHYPGTYAAGCYDWLPTRIAGRQVGNEDLVNLPDWSRLRYRCVPDDGPQGDWLTPDHPTLRHCGTTLDLRDGVLTRRMLFQDGHGRRLGVTHTRLVHMGDPYLAAQRTTFRAYGWSGTIEAQAVLDGDVTNAGWNAIETSTGTTSPATAPKSARTGSPDPLRPARLPPRRSHLAHDGRVLPGAHLPRVDPQQPGARVGPRPGEGRRRLAVLRGGPAQ